MKTVKVRVAVAVDRKGEWNSAGWSGNTSPQEQMTLACENVYEGERRYWLTAELELPDAAEEIDVAASSQRDGDKE